MRRCPRTLCTAVLAVLPATAAAQALPTEPISLAGGRLVIAAKASATIAPEDPGFFNYTDYEQNALRMLRLGVSTGVSFGARVAVLSEIRTESGNGFEVYALFARVRPWADRAIDLQIGRVPPTFGTFARRGYGADNPLIGYPLSYQYLTSLRVDALPASTDDLLRMRGRGWRASYPIGSQTPAPGVPLMSATRWDTGVQVRVGGRPFQLVAGVTTGSLSNPLVRDDNGGKQIAARAAYQPSAGLVIGVSGARAAFLSRTATTALPRHVDGRFIQSVFGADIEYSRDHWLVRAEGLLSWWTVPAIDPPFIDAPLRALGVSVEGQYKIRPGLYVAGRADHLGFSRITGTLYDGHPTPWDIPVTRVEVGGGYYVRRNVITKLTYQHNWRDDQFGARHRFVAAQAVYWF